MTPAFAEVPQVSHTASGHEVRWTNGCFGQFNLQGEATYFSPECNDKKIEKSQRSGEALHLASQGQETRRTMSIIRAVRSSDSRTAALR